jgi:16S rRNA (cytosine1402-N4)-methyltransferase
VDHTPVLLDETLTVLAPALEGRPGAWLIDCTLGLGGHAQALLDRFPQLRVLGIDRDPQALFRCRQRLEAYGDRLRIRQGNFHQLEALWALEDLGRPAGILADLGVSSLQLDLPERGFSFRLDGPLDMRMGDSGPTAGDVVNGYSEAELERIIRHYGEERMARRIARALVEARSEGPLETTAQLREVVLRAQGSRAQGSRAPWESRIDPATRTFQGLRIEVNQELAGLEGFLEQAVDLLEAEGRLVVISYHSLEDRIVKHTLRGYERGPVNPITGAPLPEGRIVEVLTRKPVRPSAREVAVNRRSRSARLRAVSKNPPIPEGKG